LGNLTGGTFILLCISITLGSFGQILLKMGLGKGTISPGGGVVHTVIRIAWAMLESHVALGLMLYVISTFFWLMVISRVRLSVAYPLISMSYFVVVFLSAVILRERVNWGLATAGLVFISGGVSLIGLGMGKAGKVTR